MTSMEEGTNPSGELYVGQVTVTHLDIYKQDNHYCYFQNHTNSVYNIDAVEDT